MLPIAAIGVLVAVIVVGSAVDLSRSYLARQQIQAACDAAVLAGRRTVTSNGFDTAAQNAAGNYFQANFSDDTQGTHGTGFDASSPDDGNTVVGTARTVVDTLLMRVFGHDSTTITVTCASSMGVGNADVMMVLDTTGSMNSTLSRSQTRIQALRAAMKNFYATMTSATASTNARIRYGFVPYSSSVNVGRLLMDLDPSYIVDRRTYQSRQYKVDTSSSTTSSWEQGSKSYSTENACNSAKLANETDYKDYGSGSNKTQRMYEYKCQKVSTGRFSSAWFIFSRYSERRYEYVYGPVEWPTSVYKTFAATTTPTGDYGANVSSTWSGCIIERSTVAQATFSYSSLTGISPKEAYDLDIDSPPESSSDATKWAPLWPEVAFRRWDDNGYTRSTTRDGDTAPSPCPTRARVLSEMSESEFNAVANSLVPDGNTYLDIGMIWGGRMISPDGIFSEVVNEEPDNGGEVSRHIIFMTDGVMEPNNIIQQAWGMEFWDRRVTSDGSSGDAARHTSRFLASCEAIKNKGIRVWVVAFTSGLSNDLKTCASDSSSFTANSAKELNTAFQEIAKQVGELRVIE
ncbi:pilus assembly protein TadG-related protein [Novosphingobium soli]|uniref:pilus assembly protein TadG-related protein n=1 Tax=Novosphingobium soli TaxID=574956 RepID=UPI0036D331E2